MDPRTGLLGLFQAVALEGFEEGINKRRSIQAQHPIDLRTLVYGALIQSGLDHIGSSSLDYEYLPEEAPLRRRFRTIDPTVWGRSFIAVHSMFQSLVPGYETDKNVTTSVRPLVTFLVDLMHAISIGGALIQVVPTFDLSRMKRVLPAEILVPTSILLNAIAPVTSESLVLVSVVDRDAVVRFEEVVNSQLFLKYSRAHGLLDTSEGGPERACAEIASSAIELYRKHQRELLISRVASHLLPISSKLASSIVSWLPNDFSEFIAARLQGMIDRRQRIVIYDAWHIPHEIIQGASRSVVHREG